MTSNNASCGTAACESLAKEPLVGRAQPVTNTVFYIEKMDCPSEERQIRARLGQIAGVESLGFDLAQHNLTGQHLPGLADVIAMLNATGLVLVNMLIPDVADWDAFYALRWQGAYRWLVDHPDHALHAAVRGWMQHAQTMYFGIEREYLGWGVFILGSSPQAQKGVDDEITVDWL